MPLPALVLSTHMHVCTADKIVRFSRIKKVSSYMKLLTCIYVHVYAEEKLPPFSSQTIAKLATQDAHRYCTYTAYMHVYTQENRHPFLSLPFLLKAINTKNTPVLPCNSRNKHPPPNIYKHTQNMYIHMYIRMQMYTCYPPVITPPAPPSL